jgi:CelD/BcsL family acetyltransferase involved in cellulose biosynthesis
MTEITNVEAFGALADLAPWRGDLARLARASRRPSPFTTPEYLAAYLAHEERVHAGSEPLLLLAFAGPAPVGFLALRRRPERILGLPCTRLEFLTTRDSDRPAVVALPEDERACAEAFYRHLATREAGWSTLELAEQDEASGLVAAASVLPRGRFLVRRYPNNPNGTVVLGPQGFGPWFQGLTGEQRSKVTRRARALLGPGDVELMVSDDRRALPELLDLYLDIEARSWKVVARAGISRHPERIAFFRSLMAAHQPASPVFLFLVRDGLPIAGFLTLSFERCVYGLEMAFDEAESELSPGNVLMLLAIRDAAARGGQAFNMLGNFEYHKARWGAAVTETSAVQVFRRGSPPHLKALAGALRRRVLGTGPTQRDVEYNLSRQGRAASPSPVDRAASRAGALATVARLTGAGHAVERLAGAALAALLPFEIPGLSPASGSPAPRRRGQRAQGTATPGTKA